MTALDRLDLWIMRLTPLLVMTVLVISLFLLAVTQQSVVEQARAAEARTERLIDVLDSDRGEWEPALVEIERKLDLLLEEQP